MWPKTFNQFLVRQTFGEVHVQVHESREGTLNSSILNVHMDLLDIEIHLKTIFL